jgi:ABC-type lipoprotein export system ATPase subunit
VTSAISVEAVSMHYATPAGVVQAVDDISADVEPGRSLAIIGPSGCGKSTLLGLIGGLDAPTAGRVMISGCEISQLSDSARAEVRREQFGFVFQVDNLLPFLTAVENVALPLALRGDEGDGGRPMQLLTELGLADVAGNLPDQLSGGQRQRVAVARALVHQPRVLLADEPTGSLDEESSAALIDVLLAAQREAGATLVVVTHDPTVARRMDATLELRDGRLVTRAPSPSWPPPRSPWPAPLPPPPVTT